MMQLSFPHMYTQSPDQQHQAGRHGRDANTPRPVARAPGETAADAFKRYRNTSPGSSYSAIPGNEKRL